MDLWFDVFSKGEKIKYSPKLLTEEKKSDENVIFILCRTSSPKDLNNNFSNKIKFPLNSKQSVQNILI